MVGELYLEGWVSSFIVRNDTISAIATPIGEGALGIVRMSGERAFAIAEQMFRRSKPGPPQSHRIYYGKLVDPDTGEVLDHALMLPFRAPHSYTGEDVVEFSCHGSPYLLNRVVALTWRLGARPAEPGEFTQRAFLNGKLDMVQAESVAYLIRARTEAQRRAAIALHEGVLSKAIRQLSERVLGLLAQVEAVIDFAEEIGELDTESLSQSLQALEGEMELLLATAQVGRLLREGVRTAIVGRPNVGKSSLLNRLLGEERAIVTPIAGTTRDTLEEVARIEGVPFVLTDTAGLRQSEDLVEQIGVERTRQVVQSADLILLVLDVSEGLTEADREILLQLPLDRPCIVVWNKADLLKEWPSSAMLSLKAGDGRELPACVLSALTGEGVSALHQAMLQAVQLHSLQPESILLTHERHAEAVRRALLGLQSARAGLQQGLSPDLIAVDLRSAWLALGEITGETLDAELVNRIFREFCIGK